MTVDNCLYLYLLHLSIPFLHPYFATPTLLPYPQEHGGAHSGASDPGPAAEIRAGPGEGLEDPGAVQHVQEHHSGPAERERQLHQQRTGALHGVHSPVEVK